MAVLTLALYPLALLVLYAACGRHYTPTGYSAIIRLVMLAAFAPYS